MVNTGPIMKGMMNGGQTGISSVSGDNNDVGDIFKMLVSTLSVGVSVRVTKSTKSIINI